MFFTWPSKSWFASTPLHVPMVLVGGHSFEAKRAASRREKGLVCKFIEFSRNTPEEREGIYAQNLKITLICVSANLSHFNPSLSPVLPFGIS